MAVFQSGDRELSFYVNDSIRSFSGGSYTSEDADEIAVLERLSDAVRVDTEEVEVKAEASKPPTRRKPSAK